MTSTSVDWQALDFTCIHEDDLLPKPDAEAEAWYQTANSLYKSGSKTNNQEYLKQSFELMLKAAERDHIKAMNNVVLAYVDGDGVKTNEAKGVEWAEKLMRLNSGRGYYHMGTFLQQGIGVKQDRKAALTYFRKAADLGNSQGQLVAGDKLLEVFAQSPDREKGLAIGITLLQCALAQGLSEAGYKLAHHYAGASKNYDEALKTFQAAAKLGHNQSLFELKVIFRDGEYGVVKDEARAACYQRLQNELAEDKTKKFPDLDRICPLPPKRMANS